MALDAPVVVPDDGDSSGSCLIAHQTMQISPISGIFSASMNHRNPQVTTPRSYPDSARDGREFGQQDTLPTGRSRPDASAAQRDRLLDEVRDPLKLGDPLRRSRRGVSRATRSTPNSSTLKEASAVP